MSATTDTEGPVVVDPPAQQACEQNAGLDHGPRVRRHKRKRSPEGEWSENDDDDYLPYRRAKLSRSSTRTIHAVRK